MTELMSLTPGELKEWCLEQGMPGFRAGQLFAWLHKGARFAEMTNLPKPLREQLQATAVDQPVEILTHRRSKLDDTVKFLFGLRDGNCVEGVLMKYHYGRTLCISTQVGCRMGCTFCASTLDGCVRSLTPGEMLGEITAANRFLTDGERVHNVVLMGSGEPLDNYDNVMKFLRLLREPQGLCISLRSVSLSTCGLVPKMYDLANEDLPVTLSVSLHEVSHGPGEGEPAAPLLRHPRPGGDGRPVHRGEPPGADLHLPGGAAGRLPQLCGKDRPAGHL